METDYPEYDVWEKEYHLSSVSLCRVLDGLDTKWWDTDPQEFLGQEQTSIKKEHACLESKRAIQVDDYLERLFCFDSMQKEIVREMEQGGMSVHILTKIDQAVEFIPFSSDPSMFQTRLGRLVENLMYSISHVPFVEEDMSNFQILCSGTTSKKTQREEHVSNRTFFRRELQDVKRRLEKVSLRRNPP